MPSIILGNPQASGPQIIVSGNPWSGKLVPVGSIDLFWTSSGGNAYVGTSGNMTMTSGGMFLSGGGVNDGMMIPPGARYTIPKCNLNISGTITVYANCDVAASGLGRLYYTIN